MGPGTTAMLLGVAVFAIYSYTQQPSTPTSKYYEADASGKLVEVARPTANARSPGPMVWKPTPRLLLDYDFLSPAQKAEIEAIEASWQKERAELEELLNAAIANSGLPNSKSESENRQSVVDLKGGLASYSALSRRFDRARDMYWQRALAMLTANQRKKLIGSSPLSPPNIGAMVSTTTTETQPRANEGAR